MNKRVLVTGGARRIGAAICRRLARAGWGVVIHCNASRAEADALAREIGAAGVVQANLEDAAATARLVGEAGGRLDALVNNASLFLHDTAEEFSPEQFARHTAVNLLAPAILSREFAAQAPESGGAIVNLLDNRLFAANPDFFTYALGKYGLLGMTEMHALAFAPRVRVNGVAPSITMVSGDQTDENFRRAHVNNPLRRGVEPEDVAEAVAYLLDAPSVTGTVLVVDGGQRLRRRGRDVAFEAGQG